LSTESVANPTQKTAQAEQTKEEFILACVADGTAREVCEARWNAAHQTNPEVPAQMESAASTGVPTMADLAQEVEMLRGRLEVRERQLTQAIDIANRANEEAKAKTLAQKEMLINSIQMDSNFSKDELTKKALPELQVIRLTLDKSMAKTFASVAAEVDAAKRKKKPHLTAGAWDREKQQWVGGI